MRRHSLVLGAAVLLLLPLVGAPTASIASQSDWNQGIFDGSSADRKDNSGDLGIGYLNQTSVAISRQNVDDFEDGDLSEWSGDLGQFAVTSNQVLSGSQSLEASNTDNVWHRVMSENGLPNYVEKGSEFHVYHRTNILQEKDNNIEFGVDPDNEWNDLFKLKLDHQNQRVLLVEDDGGSSTVLIDDSSVSWGTDQWFRIEIVWDDADGTLTGTPHNIQIEVYNVSSGAQNGNTMSATSSANAENTGIKLAADGADASGESIWYDNWTIVRQVRNPGLAAYWRLDKSSGSALDYSGNGYDVDLASSESGYTRGETGVFGTNAVDFDGSSNYNTTFFPSEQTRTMSYWVKFDSFGPDGNPDSIGTHDANNRRFYLGVNQSGHLHYGYGDNYSSNYYGSHSDYDGLPGVQLETGRWYHLAMTADGSTAKVYVNGEEKDSFSYDFNSGQSDMAFHIGSKTYNTYTNYYLDGTVDEVRVYNRGLSGQEIKELYFNGKSGETTKVIESFESGDLSDYEHETGSYMVTDPASVNPTHGSYVLARDGSSGTSSYEEIYATDSAGIEFPQAGDTFRYKVAPGAFTDGNAHQHTLYFGYNGDGSNWQDTYTAWIRWDMGRFYIRARNSTADITNLDYADFSSPTKEAWHEVEVQWPKDPTSNPIQATLYDENGNELASASGTAPDWANWTSGRIGWRTWTAGPDLWFDYLHDPAATSAGSFQGNYTSDVIDTGRQQSWDSVEVDATIPGTVDGFEDGDLSEYSLDTNLFTTQSGTTWDGASALNYSRDASRDELLSSSGLPRYPQSGDSFEFYVRAGSVADSAHHMTLFGAQDESNAYAIDIHWAVPDWRLNRREGGSANNLDQEAVSFSADTWYRVEVDWTEDNNITARLYNAETGDHLSTLSAVDSTYTSGGIGFAANGNGQSMYWDNFRLTGTDADMTFEALDSDGVIVDSQSFRLADGVNSYDLSVMDSEDARWRLDGTSAHPERTWEISDMNVHYTAVSGGCTPPASGDWVITMDCTVDTTVSPPANVQVRDSSLLHVTKDGEIAVNLTANYLWVENGSTVFVSGGDIY